MKTLKYLTLTIGLALFFSPEKSCAYDANFSFGNLCEYVGKIQTDDKGSINICSLNPYVAGAIDYTLNNKFIFSNEYGFTLPQSGRDKNISKSSLFALANIKYIYNIFHATGGFGFFISRIQGPGGEENLNNGNSHDSFPLPDTTVYALNLILNLGFGVDINKEWSADLHTFIFNTFTSEDRAFSIAINGSYHFGEF
jgi:hypothetical protein